MNDNFYPRDYVETEEGLIFSVVADALDEGRVPAFLRYHRQPGETFLFQLNSSAANQLLRYHYPDYSYYSRQRDVTMHGVPVERVVKHYQPRQKIAQLMAQSPRDAIEKKLAHLVNLLVGAGLPLSAIGVTGSILIDDHHPELADIDLAIYGRTIFFQARTIVRQLLKQGDLDPLCDALWRDAYQRRGCDLSFAEYCRHEARKYNKAAIDGTKFDLGLVNPEPAHQPELFEKKGPMTLQATVLDDTYAFDFPARYRIDHPAIEEVITFTATYTGQAEKGEVIEAVGIVEQSEDNRQRLIVGADREASGHHIKVVSAFNDL